jgi:ribosomal-protein-serine acetyltransferase
VLELPRATRFELRLKEEGHAEELYALIDRHRAYLARWLPWAADQTLEATREFIRTSRRQYEAGEGVQTEIVVDGALAGMVGVHGISRLHGTTSIGYWLAPEFQGRGLMTEAVRAYVDAAFGPWGLHRVELRAEVGNARSRAVAERLGFVEEGVARQAMRIGDRRVDDVVYSVLAPEWTSATMAE